VPDRTSLVRVPKDRVFLIWGRPPYETLGLIAV
jgi:hypothetical protein